jgi:CubicO group peptidase (beta-lactamase class C family)
MKKTSSMNPLKNVFLAAIIFLGLSLSLMGQEPDKLPRSNPELEGVSSSGIIDFFNAVDTNRVELHSFMFIRHGKVIAESWWKPFGPNYKHIMYSASKTFTATSVGLAVSENKLKVTDKVISFFPYSLPDTISDFMKELTVRDLLTMSVGQDPEPSARGTSEDWMTKFMKTAPVYKPGTVFKYNNMASFMLSAIVQQVTGQPIYDYLMPRIFKPLGIRGIDWDLNPQGINLGMIGLRLRTEDMAKFGQLLLNGGVWNKKQLIPKEWVNEATSFKISNYDANSKKPKELDDWAQGYCYQMWRGRNNTVRLDGMAGQFVVLIPDKDAIVVFTANASNTQKELNLIHDYLLPAIQSDKALAPNPALQDEIQKRKEKLSINPGFAASVKSSMELKIAGKEFILGNNDYNLQSVYFSFDNNECTFALKRNNTITKVKAGADNWKITNTTATSILAPSRNASSKSIDASYSIEQPIIKLAARYSWTENSVLEIAGRFVEESLAVETFVCKFTEQNGAVRVTIEPKGAASQSRSPMGAQQPVVLRGTMVKIN